MKKKETFWKKPVNDDLEFDRVYIIKNNKVANVLEFGCGDKSRINKIHFQDQNIRFYGTDITLESIKKIAILILKLYLIFLNHVLKKRYLILYFLYGF